MKIKILALILVLIISCNSSNKYEEKKQIYLSYVDLVKSEIGKIEYLKYLSYNFKGKTLIIDFADSIEFLLPSLEDELHFFILRNLNKFPNDTIVDSIQFNVNYPNRIDNPRNSRRIDKTSIKEIVSKYYDFEKFNEVAEYLFYMKDARTQKIIVLNYLHGLLSAKEISNDISYDKNVFPLLYYCVEECNNNEYGNAREMLDKMNDKAKDVPKNADVILDLINEIKTIICE